MAKSKLLLVIKIVCIGLVGSSCWAAPSALDEVRDLELKAQKAMEPYLDTVKAMQDRFEQAQKESKAEILEYLSPEKKTGTKTCPEIQGLAETKVQAGELYVFVSSSMPQPALIQLFKETRNKGGTVVLQGLKENSYPKTIQFFKETMAQSGLGFIIHPELFTQYEVTAVPSIVLTRQYSKKSTFDKITGHISLAYALELFKANGELKEEAIHYLEADYD